MNMKLILWAGQSNSTDAFNINANLADTLQALQRDFNIYNKPVDDSSNNGSWARAYVGHNYPTQTQNTQSGAIQTNRFAVHVSMANRLKYTYNHQTYLIPCGIISSYIANDVSPGWNSSHVGEYYDRMINYYWTPGKTALPSQFSGIEPIFVWIHGESDSDTLAHGQAYYANMVAFINKLRTDTGYSNMQVIITKLRSDYGGVGIPVLGLADVRQAQVDLANNISNVTLIDTDDPLYPLADQSGTFQHYTPCVDAWGGVMGAVNLGNKIADVIMTL
jgi:hypothetical protein